MSIKEEVLCARFSTVEDLQKEIKREQDELQKFKKKENGLKNELLINYSFLQDLQKIKSSILKKSETLSSLSSNLSRSLLKENQKKYENIENKISFQKKEQIKIQEDLNNIQRDIGNLEASIAQKEKEPDIYISLQCRIMVSKFFEYFQNHIKNFGMEIQKKFCIKEVTENFASCKIYGGSTEVPTGKLGIYEVDTKKFVVTSDNFYFECKLYDYVGDDSLYIPICINTNWYNKYSEKFTSELLKTLEKEYHFDEFELTIDKQNFTFKLK